MEEMLLISDAAEAFLRSFGRLLEPSTALQMYEGEAEGYRGYLTSGPAVTTSPPHNNHFIFFYHEMDKSDYLDLISIALPCRRNVPVRKILIKTTAKEMIKK